MLDKKFDKVLNTILDTILHKMLEAGKIVAIIVLGKIIDQEQEKIIDTMTRLGDKFR